MIVKIPGGLGIMSPIRTNAIPAIITPLLPKGPIISGYGNPQTELIIKQSELPVASGIPPAVAIV
jgi:hypothetical protein